MTLLTPMLLALADTAAHGHAAGSLAEVPPLHFTPAAVDPTYSWLAILLIAPVVSALLCGALAIFKVPGRWPAVFTVTAFATAAARSFTSAGAPASSRSTCRSACRSLTGSPSPGARAVEGFTANIGFYIDGITLLWMLFVTALATLIALFASEYMETDVKSGYARFFFGVSLFVASMLILVMSDNLIGLYLGWKAWASAATSSSATTTSSPGPPLPPRRRSS